ncbi:MAG: ankyrin repeat domain-containing protein [Alphaproteobacteria bacterium]|nr:ankyrin repeat domain-containing protein [Alphaproteobacteria bacterium]
MSKPDLKITAFLQAAHNGDLEAMQASNIDIDTVDEYGSTALIMTVNQNTTSAVNPDFQRKNSVEAVVEWLLKKGANPAHQEGNGYNAVHHAAYNGNCKALRLLLKNSPHLVDVPVKGWTALQLAVRNNHYETTQYLIAEASAKLDVKLVEDGKEYSLMDLATTQNMKDLIASQQPSSIFSLTSASTASNKEAKQNLATK